MLEIIEDDRARSLLQREEVVGLMEAAYRAAAAGAADVSHPSAMMMRGQNGSDTHFKVKGAVLDSFGVAGFRLIADGADTVEGRNAYLYVMDSRSGRPFGLVSESWVHRIRTATTGLVTCRALWPERVTTLALIGTGRIAEEFLRSCHLVLPQVEIVMTSRSVERARASAQAWQGLTPYPLRAAPMREALAAAEVVVTLSDAAEHLFEASDLQPDALICAMGGRYEFGRDVLDASESFIVDEIDFACTVGSAARWIETGAITRPEVEARLDATIGEILAGDKKVPRGRRTLAIIQGMAICDLVLAKTVLDRAREPAFA